MWVSGVSESNPSLVLLLRRRQVQTWGLFPRPRDISRAYGGGRNLKPGQPLESKEEEEARKAK